MPINIFHVQIWGLKQEKYLRLIHIACDSEITQILNGNEIECFFYVSVMLIIVSLHIFQDKEF